MNARETAMSRATGVGAVSTVSVRSTQNPARSNPWMTEFVTHIGMSVLDRTEAVTIPYPFLIFPTVVGSGRRSWGRATLISFLSEDEAEELNV